MKIVTNKECFIQKKDLYFIMNCNYIVPDFIYNKLIIYKNKEFMKDEEYVKFTSQDDIEYLKNIDFVIDLNKLRKYDYKKIVTIYYKNINKYKENRNIDQLEYKLNSLKEILEYKINKKNLDIPSELKNNNKLKKHYSIK